VDADRAHILVMNDSQELLDLFQALLEAEGYRVSTSIYVLDWTRVKDLAPDVIVIDILFERQIKGWEFLTMARLDPGLRQIPIILCTAAIRTVEAMREQLTTVNVVVVYKPFELEQLLDQIAACVCRLAADRGARRGGDGEIARCRDALPPLRHSARRRRSEAAAGVGAARLAGRTGSAGARSARARGAPAPLARAGVSAVAGRRRQPADLRAPLRGKRSERRTGRAGQRFGAGRRPGCPRTASPRVMDQHHAQPPSANATERTPNAPVAANKGPGAAMPAART
jgi:CheY-like chemotaxis protein